MRLKKKDLLLRVSIVPLILLALLVMLFTEAPLSDYDRISVIIVHTNDVHGSIWAKESEMGYAHMAAIVKEIREANNNVLYWMPGILFKVAVWQALGKVKALSKS